MEGIPADIRAGGGAGPVVRGLLAALVALAATTAASLEASGQTLDVPAGRDGIRDLLATLAHDSLRGRMTATPGARSAARIIAEQLRSYGLEPVGGDGYFQRVPLVRSPDSGRLGLPEEGESADGVEHGAEGINVLGMVRGSDPEVANEAIVVGAHYDHLGVGTPVAGDSIYNGADDDASGVVAVLAAARALAAGEPPRRSVIIFLSTGEELGLLGTRWYIRNPVVPLERTAANLQVEMIGRPDPLAGGPGRVWLTGFERSSMGEILRSSGIPVVPDPRPAQQFFLRSDNIAFAREGIPAHTLSSYGMHDDYHTPEDELERVDLDHMVGAVDAVVRSVRTLANAEAPEWNPGGRPEGARE
ncbi:MAG: M28 family peptidase [Gemmatimonadota bacterium]